MQNGYHKMRKYVLGVKKPWKDQWDVILWPVLAANIFAICVRNHGNPIIKTILNVIYISKGLMMLSVGRKK